MEAVLISAVSVLGTIAGALVTAVTAARSERRKDSAAQRQLEAQEETARRAQEYERAVEHRRWRRDRCQAAYLAFLQGLGNADRANQEFFRSLQETPSGGALDDTRLREIRERFKEAESLGHAVVLEGPESIADAAHELVGRLGSLVQDVRAYAQAHAASDGDLSGRGAAVHTAGMAYVSEHREFLGAARAALDDSEAP
ncbi:hypothetical protein [Streptomyces ehimensis]|uniref:Secreted protein n=1 Tax=Streptomyces ehimensis TaxID=68195 RepID=A0ABV9BBM5_9ACTN